MLLSREYVQWLERLPCNRHARRRHQKHGQWLDGWVPDVSGQAGHMSDAVIPDYANFKNSSPS